MGVRAGSRFYPQTNARIDLFFTMSDNTCRRHKPATRNEYGRTTADSRGIPTGGARRDRTDDLMLAKHALSQLSYGPERVLSTMKMVGLGRLELPTSRLSSARSNQLSYKPPTAVGSGLKAARLVRARPEEREA